MSAREGPARPEHVKIIAKNRRATFDYTVESKLECGVQLRGTEVKSLRDGKAQLSDAYAIGKYDELFLVNCHIPPYDPAGPLLNHAPNRDRKLLLHRAELDKILEQQKKAGYTLIPLSLYFKDGKVKVELGVCKGKQGQDKREHIAEREAKREIDRGMRRK